MIDESSTSPAQLNADAISESGVFESSSADPDGASLQSGGQNTSEAGEPARREQSSSPLPLVLMIAAVVGIGVWKGWALVAVIGCFVAMIFLHELGHFLTAKWGGMKVTQFFLGFGPTVWSFRRGETEFGIKAIPAGAFVKVPGMMRDDPVEESDESRTYRRAPFHKRVIFAAAGSTTHFALALVLLFGHAFWVGNPDPANYSVRYVYPDSAADRAGVQVGDRIATLDGVKLESEYDLGRAVQARAGKSVQLTVVRDGRTVPLEATLGSRVEILGTVAEDIGIFFTNDGPVAATRAGGVAESAGLQNASKVVTINSTAVKSPADVSEALKASVGGEIKFGIEGSTTPVSVDLGSAVGATKAVGQIGVASEVPTAPLTFWQSVRFSERTFRSMISETVTQLPKALNPSNLFGLFKRAATTAPVRTDPVTTPTSATDVMQAEFEQNSSRPLSLVGSVDLVTSLTEQNWGELFFWMATMNLFIGVFNLIPLLPFDGGHIALACYEKVRELVRGDGQRYLVNPARVYPVAMAVVGLLGLLFLSSMYLDVVDPIRFG